MVRACARSFSPCWQPSSEHRRWAKGRREVGKCLPMPGMVRSPPHRDLCHQSCAAKGPCPVPAHAALAVARLMPMSPRGHEPQARDLCIGVSGPGSFLHWWCWWDWPALLLPEQAWKQHPCQHRGCSAAPGLTGGVWSAPGCFSGSAACSSSIPLSRVSMTTKCFLLPLRYGHDPGLSHPAYLSTPFGCLPPPLPPRRVGSCSRTLSMGWSRDRLPLLVQG